MLNPVQEVEASPEVWRAFIETLRHEPTAFEFTDLSVDEIGRTPEEVMVPAQDIAVMLAILPLLLDPTKFRFSSISCGTHQVPELLLATLRGLTRPPPPGAIATGSANKIKLRLKCKWGTDPQAVDELVRVLKTGIVRDSFLPGFLPVVFILSLIHI